MNDVDRAPERATKVTCGSGTAETLYARFIDDRSSVFPEGPIPRAVKQPLEGFVKIEAKAKNSGSTAFKLFTGPNGIHICHDCLEVCEEILRHADQPPQKTSPQKTPSYGAVFFKYEAPRCSCCLKSEDEVGFLIPGPRETSYICADCVVRFRENID